MASADSTQQRRKARPQPALLEGGFVDAPLGVQLHLRTDQSNRQDALDGDGRGRTPALGMAGAGDCIAHVAIAAPRDAKADVKAAWQYEAISSSDPREPVLFLRCGGLADAEALAANVDGSWSPKIAAVLKTSLGGAPPTTGLSPRLLFTHAATAWMNGERWARLQLAKLGVGSPRHAACAFKED